jgi:putative pyruvate formate lyase activating enzyme
LCVAVEKGLRLPLVYNTGAYDHPDTLRLLEGVVDVYMPDFKFWAPGVSEELASASDYRQVACAAIREMHRQVGDLEIDDEGLARRGLLVRHLVMPNDQAGTRDVMRFLAREVSPNTYVNVRAQYRPEGHARRHDKINRPVTLGEFSEALAIAREEGLRRADHY